MKSAETAKTLQAKKQDSLHQFGYYPVLGINIFSKLVPIRGSILVGPNRIKQGVFYAGQKPDHCFWRKECLRTTCTRKDLIAYTNWYKDGACEYKDCDGNTYTPKWQEHIEECGVVKDSCNRPLSISVSKSYWVGTTYYQPNTMSPADDYNYAYPECCYELPKERGKLGVREWKARDNACSVERRE